MQLADFTKKSNTWYPLSILFPLNIIWSVPAFPVEFEKDDDSNHHIDFIAAAANLRAEK